MRALYFKELRGFFNTLTGVIVLCVFLLLNSAFLWIFKGGFNLLDSGWANLDGLFIISPWVFMFLLPAITMRMFAEEKRYGTLELLFTKPLSEWHIVLAKFFAAVSLVLFSLLPTLLYFYSIYQLGTPIGSIDSGVTWGSFIGLFFLGCAYASMGLFASSLSDNPIIAFLMGAFLCFFFFFGLSQLASLPFLSSFQSSLNSIGINDHYISLSRGVIDSRDVIYFVSLSLLFLAATRVKLLSRNW